MDISDWESQTTEFNCLIGLYNSEGEYDIVDWQTIDMLYNGEDEDATLTCKDGNSFSFEDFEFNEDDRSECNVMNSKSSASYDGDNAEFKNHWMRAVNTGDSNDDDIVLIMGDFVSASVQVKLGDNEPIRRFNVEMCVDMGSCEEASANTLGATSALLALVLISSIWG